MPEHDHSLSDEPELSLRGKLSSSLTLKQEEKLSQMNPSTALSPYEDPRKVEEHFPQS